MAKSGPGFLEFGPDDVESVEMTFRLGGGIVARFSLSDDGGEDAKFIRDLYGKLMDTYGPGGSKPLPFELTGAPPEKEAV